MSKEGKRNGDGEPTCSERNKNFVNLPMEDKCHSGGYKES